LRRALLSASFGFSLTYSVSYSLNVDAPGGIGAVKVIGTMINASTVNGNNGVLTLNPTELSVHVLSNNASVPKAILTTPTGYIGMSKCSAYPGYSYGMETKSPPASTCLLADF
jgi:hypothetical protein